MKINFSSQDRKKKNFHETSPNLNSKKKKETLPRTIKSRQLHPRQIGDRSKDTHSAALQRGGNRRVNSVGKLFQSLDRSHSSRLNDRAAIGPALITRLICLSGRKALNQRLRAFYLPRVGILPLPLSWKTWRNDGGGDGGAENDARKVENGDGIDRFGQGKGQTNKIKRG